MHEWLEALRKSAKKALQPGVHAEDVRRAETECGVPFPDELGTLYQALDGGEFLGDVVLFPLHAAEGQPSVLEKTRLKLVGLPAAGVWRFGVKGPHRHLFAARKSAMVEQGDGGGPLPNWMEGVRTDDWVYGTWEFEGHKMRLYRSLPDMLSVLVPPFEEEDREGFGERTFARAMSAVEGVLDQLGEEAQHLLGELAALNAKKAGAPPRETEAAQEEPTVREAIEALAAKLKPTARKAPAKKAPAKKAAARKAPAKKAPVKKAAKKAPAKKAAAKKAPAKKAARKAVKKAPAKKAPARKVAAKKAPAKKGAAARRKR